MPPKVEKGFIKNLAESFAKGQPYATRIGLKLCIETSYHEKTRSLHHHENLNSINNNQLE